MTRWIIREDAPGWTVRKGRTVLGFPTEGEALRFVEQQRGDGDTVVSEESDGYRIPIRPRKHWRR